MSEVYSKFKSMILKQSQVKKNTYFSRTNCETSGSLETQEDMKEHDL